MHYLFEIAAERYGDEGVRLLESLVPAYVTHAITGELPDEQGDTTVISLDALRDGKVRIGPDFPVPNLTNPPTLAV